MEANREQALKCRDMGVAALKAGNSQKALRLLEKSFRMYPDDSTRRLIAAVSNNGDSGSAASADATPPPEAPSASATSSSYQPPESGASSAFKRHGRPSPERRDSRTAASEAASSSSGFGAPRSSPPRSKSPTGPPPRARSAGGNGSGPKNSPSPAAASSASATTTSSRGTASNASAASTVTKHQEDLCRKILGMKDHYAVLGLPKNATEEQIKKSYKKLAFQLHPDKNKSVKAEEAFKKVSRAFQSLSDPEKRQVYDRYGTDDDVPKLQRAQYESDFMSPEELFEVFFGVNPRQGHQRRFRRQQPTAEQQRVGGLVQIIPILILLAITLLTSIFQDSPKANFDFQRSAAFPLERETQQSHIKYYAAENFDKRFPARTPQRREVEYEVELAYYHRLCTREQNERVRQMQGAAYESKNEAERRKKIEKIQARELPNCRSFTDLQTKRGRLFGFV